MDLDFNRAHFSAGNALIGFSKIILGVIVFLILLLEPESWFRAAQEEAKPAAEETKPEKPSASTPSASSESKTNSPSSAPQRDYYKPYMLPHYQPQPQIRKRHSRLKRILAFFKKGAA